jgi:hypothetical protein
MRVGSSSDGPRKPVVNERNAARLFIVLIVLIALATIGVSYIDLVRGNTRNPRNAGITHRNYLRITPRLDAKRVESILGRCPDTKPADVPMPVVKGASRVDYWTSDDEFIVVWFDSADHVIHAQYGRDVEPGVAGTIREWVFELFD